MSEAGRIIEDVLRRCQKGSLVCYDHADRPSARYDYGRQATWCCGCGAHGLTVSWEAHVAAEIEKALGIETTGEWEEA